MKKTHTKIVPETDLHGIIQRIKEEGLEEARKRSDEITKEGEKKTHEILEQARREAKEIIREAGEEAKKREEIGRKALDQAARDLILYIKESIVDTFNSILREECRNVLSGKTLITILLHLIEGWKEDTGGHANLEVLLSEKDLKELFDFSISKLKKSIKEGMEINAHPRIEAGFHVGIKGNNFYYDFTDEGVAEVLAAYLNPKLAIILDPIREGKKG